MQEETVIHSSLLGAMVHVSVFRPKGQIVCGVIQVVHGLTEHRGMYREMGEFFSGAGYVFLAHNIIGHGEDMIDGIPAFLPKRYLPWAIRDIEQVYQDCLYTEEKSLPRIVIGFSFGSYLSRCLIQETDASVDGLVLAGPGQPGLLIQKAAGYYTRKLVQKYGSKNSGKKVKRLLSLNDDYFYETHPFRWMYANAETAGRYQEDQLAVKDVASATLEAAVHAIQRANAPGNCRDKSIHILLLCGTRDVLTPDLNRMAEKLHEYGYLCIDKNFIFGGRHSILTDACCRSTWKEILNWIEYKEE